MLQIENSYTKDNESIFINSVKKFINTKNKNIIDKEMNNFSEFCFNSEPFDEKSAIVSNEFVNELNNILLTKDLLQMKESYHFIIFFLNDWGRFTLEQKKDIILTFEKIFQNIEDNTSRMVIIEIISEYMANENSLRILNKLEDISPNKKFKYLIPYGYRLLIENSNNIDIQKKALARLISMKNDSLENVQKAANNAYLRISKDEKLKFLK